MIQGYVDSIEPTEVGGWAYDEASPGAHVEVEIWFKGELLRAGPADAVRGDLVQGKVGKGDHGFRFKLPAPLDPAALSSLVVRARLADAESVELRRWKHAVQRLEASTAGDLKPPGQASDPAPRPVFVIGAARSGTSVVTHALLRSTAYKGHDEGHLIELIGHLDRTVEQVFAMKERDVITDQNSIMLKTAGRDFLSDAIASVFISATQQLFPAGLWLDKTPNWMMVSLAPRLARIWPNARFIFMRRRGFENVASRLRKYPGHPFRQYCEEWSQCMRTWTDLRAQMHGRALELDQLCVARAPRMAADEIGALLGLSAIEVDGMTRRFTFARPEVTSAEVAAASDVGDLGWSAQELREFEDVCGEWMDRFNYSRDSRYFASDAPANLFSRV